MKHALIAFFLFPVLLIAQPRFKWTQIEVAPGQGYLVSSQGVNGSWEDSLRFYGGLMRITGGLTMSDVTAITGDSMLVWRNNKVYRRGFRQALSAANAVYGTGLESSIPVWATDSTLGFSTWYLVSNQIGYNNLSPVYQFDMRSSTNSAVGLPNVATASLPAGYSGGLLYNTTAGNLGFYGAAAWEYPVISATGSGLGTSGRVFYAGPSGRANANDLLHWDLTNNFFGIGTNTPLYPIHVESTTASVNRVMYLTSASTTSTGLLINNSSGATANKTWSFSTTGTTSAAGDGLFVFYNQQPPDVTLMGLDGPNRRIISNQGASIVWATGNQHSLINPDVGISRYATGAIRINNGTSATTSATGGVIMPSGTTAQRPTAADYLLRGNSSNTKLETYYSAAWHNIATETWVTANYATPAQITWTLAGDSGTPQAVTSTQTATWAGGWGINTSVGGTRTVTVEVDSSQVATQHDISGLVSSNIYTANGTISEERTVTVSNGLFFTWNDYTYMYMDGSSTSFEVSSESGLLGGIYNQEYGPYIRASDASNNLSQIVVNNDPLYVELSSQSLGGSYFMHAKIDSSEFHIRKSGMPDTKYFAVKNGGGIQFHTYGSGTFTGTAAYNLAVDASGNVIEVSTTGADPAISDLDPATATNTIDNANYAQTWTWNTLAGGNGLSLTSTSTAAASNLQRLLNISLSGANANSNQLTYGAYVSNTHTGTNAFNYGIRALASGGSNNIAIYGSSAGTNGKGVSGESSADNGFGGDFQATTTSGIGYGVQGTAYGSGATTNVGGVFSAINATNNYAILATAGRVGFGTSTPATDFHTTGTVRHTGLTQDTAYQMVTVQPDGDIVRRVNVRPDYLVDADKTFDAATMLLALTHHVYIEVTSGASSASELTIPDAAAAYLNTKLAITCKDDSGSYACIVNANTATIMDPGVGTDVSTYTISPYKTVVFRVMQTGASTYRWTIQD